MKVLVAGGAGFIGSWTVEALVEKGHDVIVLDNLLSGRRENLACVMEDVEFIESDIRDRGEIFDKIDPAIDAIVHLAFPTPLCNRDLDKQFHDVASVGTANLLELALARDAHFLYGSSIAVYGRSQVLPIDENHPKVPYLAYGANKLLGEHLCGAFTETHGLNYCSLRISDTYGPRDRRDNAINNFLDATAGNHKINITGGGEQRRSYSYVADIAQAIAIGIEATVENAVFNLATEEFVSINQLAEMVKIFFDPALQITHTGIDVDQRHYVFDNSKFNEMFGQFSWTPLREGLKITHTHRIAAAS